jgi:tRNA-2-methylthio-N6-dimethylallyladenosine synthase
MAFIFKYSERSGTHATRLDDKIPQNVKEKRNQELLAILESQSIVSNQKLIDSQVDVLVEGKARKGEGTLTGRTPCFRKVVFPAEIRLIGNIVPVRITNVSTNTLFGETVS